MRRLLILTIYLLAFVVAANAVKARRGQWKTVRIEDDSEVKVELCGNEFMRYWQSEDGRKFVRNTETGLYEAADMSALRERAMARKTDATFARKGTRADGRSNVIFTGEKRGLIILVNFSDLEFDSEHTPELYDKIANEKGFSNSMGFRGSVKDYFKSQSYGQFVIDFDIAGPVTLPKSYSYYGANDKDGMEYTSRLVEFVEEACKAADEEVDFSKYDWDGDGEVEQVFLLYAGVGEATCSDEEETIWPHEWDLYSASRKRLLLDDVYVNTYACSCELSYHTQIDGIGTICHEFSHCLGIPDMYDTNYDYYGMDCWDVMDYGNYNGNSFVPAGYTSYERMFCGWSTPITLAANSTIEGMAAIGDEGDTYIIYNDANENEYYLLENRQQTGWDAGLPNSGLLILHVDYDADVWEKNEVNSTSTQHCTIFPADNDFDNNVAGDIYPYMSNNQLTNQSSPAALLNNPNSDGSYYMNKSITNITKNTDGTVTFTFTNLNVESGGVETITYDDNDENMRIYSINGMYLGHKVKGKGLFVVKGQNTPIGRIIIK